MNTNLFDMAHKLFNVVADMQGMTSDQLKGSIRNMEEIGNMMHKIFRALVNEDTENMTVMGLDWDRLATWLDEIRVPSADGGTEVVSKARSTSLLRWQLEFFHNFGNLQLEVDNVVKPTTLKVSDMNANTENHFGWMKYIEAKKSNERLWTEINETYRNITKSK
jgi:hypothetical protein